MVKLRTDKHQIGARLWVKAQSWLRLVQNGDVGGREVEECVLAVRIT